MLSTLKILAVGILVLIFSSCDKEYATAKAQSSSINKIMPVGASRVAGNSPIHESFRYKLWKDHTENNWTFNFIGTQTDEASYPIFNTLYFGINHEGNSGWTSKQILNNIPNWLTKTGAPDIVLFNLPGGNDALQNLPYEQTISNIYDIIIALQDADPEVTILIEQLAPARSDVMNAELSNYFNQLTEDVLTIASESTTIASKVIAIDKFTDFEDRLLADDVHYNEMGADFIASTYYVVL
jgi:hypothetical protein